MTIANEKSRLLEPAIREQMLAKTDERCHYCGCQVINEKLGHDSPYARRIAKQFGIAITGNWLKKLAYRRATVDHIVPVSQGGTNDPENFVVACGYCNSRRGAMPYGEYLELVKDLIEKGEHPCR